MKEDSWREEIVVLKTSHHEACEMINTYLEIKRIVGLLLKNDSTPTHAFFSSPQTQLKHTKKFNSPGQREPENPMVETYFAKHC